MTSAVRCVSQFSPVYDTAVVPSLCMFCGDDEIALVRDLQSKPIVYSRTGERLYICGHCGEEWWA